VAKKERCSGRGRRAEHVGRQKIPVVLTAVTNTPSKEGSRARNASSITDCGGRVCVFMGVNLPRPRQRFHRFPFVELRVYVVTSSPLRTST
jgi:hypothetical protein